MLDLSVIKAMLMATVELEHSSGGDTLVGVAHRHLHADANDIRLIQEWIVERATGLAQMFGLGPFEKSQLEGTLTAVYCYGVISHVVSEQGGLADAA